MNEILDNERAKYELAYRDEWYRSTNQGIELLKNFPGFFPTGISSFLDIGCGDGRLVKHMLDHGVDAFGIDFVEVPTMCEQVRSVFVCSARGLGPQMPCTGFADTG